MPPKLNPRAIQKKKYLDSLEDSLSNEGVVFFEPDINLNINEEYLTLPVSLTEIPSRELGEYLNAFTQQKLYIRTLLGRVEIEVTKAQRIYIESTEDKYKHYSSTKLSETAKERLINSDEQVKPHYYEYVEWCKKRDMLNLNIANIEDAIFLLSREVSRRNSDFEDENRNYNVGRK